MKWSVNISMQTCDHPNAPIGILFKSNDIPTSAIKLIRWPM